MNKDTNILNLGYKYIMIDSIFLVGVSIKICDQIKIQIY